MENQFLDKFSRVFNIELPMLETMEEYLEVILPAIRPWSEDLLEMEYFVEKSWLEVRDDDDFHESVLHFFQEDGQYLQSVDGNVHKGTWRLMPPGSNKILIEQVGGGSPVKSELYDLAYLDSDYFILKKHGDQVRKGRPKFFVMGFEPRIVGLSWRDCMESLFENYRSNSRFYRNAFFLAILIVVAIVLFSVY